jgi:hypothetical protein
MVRLACAVMCLAESSAMLMVRLSGLTQTLQQRSVWEKSGWGRDYERPGFHAPDSHPEWRGMTVCNVSEVLSKSPACISLPVTARLCPISGQATSDGRELQLERDHRRGLAGPHPSPRRGDCHSRSFRLHCERCADLFRRLEHFISSDPDFAGLDCRSMLNLTVLGLPGGSLVAVGHSELGYGNSWLGSSRIGPGLEGVCDSLLIQTGSYDLAAGVGARGPIEFPDDCRRYDCRAKRRSIWRCNWAGAGPLLNAT